MKSTDDPAQFLVGSRYQADLFGRLFDPVLLIAGGGQVNTRRQEVLVK
jgi:hypothetical protein